MKNCIFANLLLIPDTVRCTLPIYRGGEYVIQYVDLAAKCLHFVAICIDIDAKSKHLAAGCKQKAARSKQTATETKHSSDVCIVPSSLSKHFASFCKHLVAKFKFPLNNYFQVLVQRSHFVLLYSNPAF